MSAPLKDFLINSWQAVHIQFGKFLLVGVGNVVLTLTLYELLLYLTSYMSAFVVSATVGLLYTVLLTVAVTFGGPLTFRNIATQSIWYVAYSCIYAACLKLTVDHLGVPPALAPLPLLAVMTPLNFVCARSLIRRSPSPS
jgi:putative flippase GtrA